MPAAFSLGGTDREVPGVASLFGVWACQMDRITSCRLAIAKAGERANGRVAFSDGLKLQIEAGVRTILHPGGSKRD